MFCSIPCGQKKIFSSSKLQSTEIVICFFCALQLRHKIVIVLILLMQVSQ